MKAALVAALIVVAMSGPLAATPQDATWSAHLAGVESAGSKRIPAATVASIAALKPGSTIGPKDVEAARGRLLGTGYFAGVGYRYRNAGYSIIVTFTLEDVAWKTRVIFDNFVGMTDAQLNAAVAKDVPSFDGLAPDSEPALKRIATALERIAKESKDPGTASFSMTLEPGGSYHWRLRLDYAAGPLMICSIAIAGAPDPPAALKERKDTLVGTEFSKEQLLNFASISLAPLLGKPIRQIDAKRTDACPRGVAVTLG